MIKPSFKIINFVKTYISAGNVIFPDEVSREESEQVSPLVAQRSDTSSAVTSRPEERVSENSPGQTEYDETQPTKLPDLTAEMNSEIRRAQRSRGEVRAGRPQTRFELKCSYIKPRLSDPC